MSGAGRLRLALAVLIVGATAVVGAPGSGAATPGVTVSDTDFSPSSIKVHPDEPVVFTIIQDARYSHTITSDDDSFREQKIDWNHPKVNLPLKKPGRYAYYCRYDGSKGGGENKSKRKPREPSSTKPARTEAEGGGPQA